jgi:hypothetical protein
VSSASEMTASKKMQKIMQLGAEWALSRFLLESRETQYGLELACPLLFGLCFSDPSSSLIFVDWAAPGIRPALISVSGGSVHPCSKGSQISLRRGPSPRHEQLHRLYAGRHCRPAEL